MDVRVIYRTCPTCGTRFGQPDDPGRKRRYCSDACEQATSRPCPYCGVCGGHRGLHTVHHDQAAHDRARRRFDGLCAKADSTGFPEEADACRTKAEQLRANYGL